MNLEIIASTVTIMLLMHATCIEIRPLKSSFQPITAQHLGQGAFGQYTYGYITPTSTKSESKDTHGIIRGGYSYLDPKGYLQTVKYVADPVHGFLVAASNLPQDVPSVAYAKQRHLQRYETIKAEHAAAALAIKSQHSDIQLAPTVVHVTGDLPKDAPVVAYAKQLHLEKYEAIKAQHAALANHDPQTVAVFSAPVVQDLPAVAQAKARHLAAFEEIKARDLALQAAKAAEEEALLKAGIRAYTPLIPANGLNVHSYGYVHPIGASGALYNADGQGYSYMDGKGIIKTVNYINH